MSAIIDPYLGGVLNPAGISCADLADFLAGNGRSATSFVEFAESFEGHEVLNVDELLRRLDSSRSMCFCRVPPRNRCILISLQLLFRLE